MSKLPIAILIFLLYAGTQLWAQQTFTETEIAKKYQRAIDIRNTNSDSSLVYSHQIINWTTTNNQPKWLVKANQLIAETYYFRNERELGFNYLVEALAVSEKNNLVEDEINILYAIGMHYSRSARRANNVIDKEKIHKALEYHQKGIQLAEANNLIALSGTGYGHMGTCFLRLEEKEKALNVFQKSEANARLASDSVSIGYILDDLGSLLSEMGKKEKGKKLLLEALEIRKALKDTFPLAINLNNLGEYHLSEKDHKNAKTYFESSLELSTKKQYLDLAIHTSKLLSTVYENENQHKKAYDLKKQEMQMMDTLYSINRAKSLAEIETKYETAQKDKAILEQQQTIQQKELDLRTRNLWFVSSLGLLLLIAGFLFFLFKRKEAIAKRSALELKLAEEKERTHLQEERLRISRELHDNIGSYLTLINASIEQLPEMSSAQIAENYPDLQKALSLSMRELRKTVWLLNNQEISIDALALRLRDFFKPLNQNGTKIIVRSQGNTEKTLTDIQATHLFRIIQEAVSNAYKYAKAQNIYINIEVTDKICFSITDDGIGFEASAVQNGNGLKNMQSRITELKGELQIKSEPNKGTKVSGCF
ncbi:MAG: sensor histidine kinase [Bacteroidetes bacterium]|jgi:signal transduction histidine kinase|nr:sensor histidine kinase [Bacteroidota bacterium]